MIVSRPPFAKMIICGLALIALSACQVSGDGSELSSSPDPSAFAALMLMPDAPQSTVATNSAICADIGGTWRRDGLMGAYHCFEIYSDAGQSCTDSAQCDGECRVTGHTETVGQCQADSGPFGCYGEMIDGKATAFLCVD